VVALRQIDSSSLSDDQKQATLSTNIADAHLTGKVQPTVDDLNNFYQSPDASSADKTALAAAANAALLSLPKK
jgi:hypothetical protein